MIRRIFERMTFLEGVLYLSPIVLSVSILLLNTSYSWITVWTTPVVLLFILCVVVLDIRKRMKAEQEMYEDAMRDNKLYVEEDDRDVFGHYRNEEK